MKKLLFVFLVGAFAACGGNSETPAVDTAAATVETAPAADTTTPVADTTAPAADTTTPAAAPAAAH